jgi:hypothetical protein
MIDIPNFLFINLNSSVCFLGTFAEAEKRRGSVLMLRRIVTIFVIVLHAWR